MADHFEQEQPSGGSLYMSISNTIVRLLREYTGRGPTKARTTIRDNVVLVMLDQTLTKGEQSLVAKGRADKVLEVRHEFQEAMRDESMAKVHIDPDLGAEIFILDSAPQRDGGPSDADA